MPPAEQWKNRSEFPAIVACSRTIEFIGAVTNHNELQDSPTHLSEILAAERRPGAHRHVEVAQSVWEEGEEGKWERKSLSKTTSVVVSDAILGHIFLGDRSQTPESRNGLRSVGPHVSQENSAFGRWMKGTTAAVVNVEISPWIWAWRRAHYDNWPGHLKKKWNLIWQLFWDP